ARPADHAAAARLRGREAEHRDLVNGRCGLGGRELYRPKLRRRTPEVRDRLADAVVWLAQLLDRRAHAAQRVDDRTPRWIAADSSPVELRAGMDRRRDATGRRP